MQLTPLMGGLLVTSIVSGQLISRYGRYRPFPIAGTALAVVGLYLLSRLHVDTPAWQAMAYATVLGLGLGAVMQVLVLAVQNDVDPRDMGVATSGSTLFRQIGGSIGVSLFGAIFANRLATELGIRLPAGSRIPNTTDPATILALPTPVRNAFEEAFAAALHPVFLSAAVVALFAFALTWLLREVPLQRSPVTQAPPPGFEPDPVTEG